MLGKNNTVKNFFEFNGNNLSPSKLVELASDFSVRFKLGEKAKEKIASHRKIIESVLNSEKSIYSINTGFGFLSDVRIPKDQLTTLQENLIRSHACGVGDPLSIPMARAVMIAKVQAMSMGHSGIRVECVEALVELLNRGITPVIPGQGSVGASGDLAPLAHMALSLMGEGYVFDEDGTKKKCAEVFERLGLKAIRLAPKEGLALINGTQFMSAVGSFAVVAARKLVATSDIVGSISLDAIRGSLVAFDARIHQLKKQPGQSITARNILGIFASGRDEIMQSHKECKKVQDAYSFRCMPQVHGASRDAINYAYGCVENDINSVSDNPLVFDGGDILSGGNFHGQALALASDINSIAIAELGSISERRTEKLTNPHMSGLPAFLVKDGGINSGFMIPHVVAASLVSENKVLSHPAVVDSIPTSADKEDHVSMGAFAARKSWNIAKNTSKILAIELIAACQGVDMLRPLKGAPAIEAVVKCVRKIVPYFEKDMVLSEAIELLAEFIIEGKLVELVKNEGVKLET